MFDIQRFSDTYTNGIDLKVNLLFADEDTRLISIPNPRSDITTEEIEAIFKNNATTAEVFIGDKTGAAYVGSDRAYTDTYAKTIYDLSDL